MVHLIYSGDVYIDSKRNFTLQIKSQKTSRKCGSLWHCMKQRIDMGFKTTFGFKIKNQSHGERGPGMNASMISGSIMGSPSK